MTSTEANHTSLWIPSTREPHVADAAFDKEVRIIVLYVEIILGAIGGSLVCLWLWANRKRKSRVNKIILHVAVSDLLVVFCACLPQLIWEYDRHWKAGEAFCKILKFVMSFAMIASNYMLVLLSVDRHEAIMYPLGQPPRVWLMGTICWSIAGVLSLPQLAIFHINYVTEPGSQFANMTVCESIFRERPMWVRQLYLTYISVVVFYIPCLIIAFCYVRIFLKISGKVSEVNNTGSNKHSTHQRPGKIVLVSSQTNSTLSSAKIKILKMSIVIIVCFIICGFPVHILEMIYSYGDHTSVPPMVASILGGLAVANSAVNPFVFLAFNWSKQCLNNFLPCVKPPDSRPSVYDSTINRGYYPAGSATCMTEVSRMDSDRCKNVISNGSSYSRLDSFDTKH